MAILYGTQSNGETLPVLVDQFGNLLAKGIEGPPGPEGPPGVGELPPGAFDGAYLGWENGELVWFGTPIPPVVIKGFRPVIYTGNGDNQLISCGFSPDLVWIKNRNATQSHKLFDSVRGAPRELSSNSTGEEANDPNQLTAFLSDGFSVGSGPAVNANSQNIIAWCWNAGDTTVTNNDGSIPSQVRSNGTFSVVEYTGTAANATFGHGLNGPAEMVIIKQLDGSGFWVVGHKSLGFTADNYARLNGTQANSSGGGDAWQSTAPTSSVVSIGRSNQLNVKDSTNIAYCWAKTPGETDFGQYNGGSRQTIQTGFRPSFVMIKSKEDGNWFMFDNARGAGEVLYANLADSGQDTGAVEFLDNGFQLLFALPGVNESDVSYIYAAFANTEDAAFAQRQLRRQARQEKRQQNETPLR